MNNKSLVCPECGTKLVQANIPHLEYEYCPHCGGVLLDAREIASYVADTIPDDQVPELPSSLSRQVITTFRKLTTQSCPRDQNQFEIINYAYDSNILLKRCPTCATLWIRQDQLLPLAQFHKGNPRMQQLGRAIAVDLEDNRPIDQVVNRPGVIRLTSVPVPVGDTTYTLETPWVTVGLMAVTVGVFGFQLLVGFENMVSQFAFFPIQVWSISSVISLFTYQFLHADIFHLVFNMWTLWIFGDNVESRLGRVKFLIFYLLAGAFSILLASRLPPFIDLPSIGASGSIAAVMGAYIVLYPKQKIKVLFWNSVYQWSAWKYLLFWISTQLIYWVLVVFANVSAGVSYGGHVAGFMIGVLVILVAKRIPRSLIQHQDISSS